MTEGTYCGATFVPHKTLKNGVAITNATPHELTFGYEDGTTEVVPSHCVISADAAEMPAKMPDIFAGVEFVTPVFKPAASAVITADTMTVIQKCGTIIVGSIIAAQAYPGLIASGIPCPGYERVPPAEKRIRPDKFSVFPPKGGEA